MKRKAGSSNEEPQPKRIGMQSEGYSTFSKRMMVGYVHEHYGLHFEQCMLIA